MKFHLSTLLLAMVIVALGLGWYLEYQHRHQRELVGEWDTCTFSGYVINSMTMLELRSDGTFRQTQRSRHSAEVYEGTYRLDKEGRIVFHVTRKDLMEPRWPSKIDDQEPQERVPLDQEYTLHWAIDRAGWLLMSAGPESLWDNSPRQLPYPVDEKQECNIRWQTSYTRSE